MLQSKIKKLIFAMLSIFFLLGLLEIYETVRPLKNRINEKIDESYDETINLGNDNYIQYYSDIKTSKISCYLTDSIKYRIYICGLDIDDHEVIKYKLSNDSIYIYKTGYTWFGFGKEREIKETYKYSISALKNGSYF